MKTPKMNDIILIICFTLTCVQSSHFRGGTINWKPTGNGNEVEFRFKLGWTYGHGPGCTETKVGQYVTGSSGNWICTSGCSTQVVLSNTSYTCTGASLSEDWEQGEHSFIYTFPNKGPFTVGFSGSAWMSLDYGSSGSWNLQTIVDLRLRNDTNKPNGSPLSGSKPMYSFQFGCNNTLKIPVVERDGDHVKCRWSVGTECSGVCQGLPNAILDQDTCTVHFRTDTSQQYKAGGWYAVAVTVEDYPNSPISIGGNLIRETQPISSIPLQFLINTPSMGLKCDEQPVFVNNTPSESSQIPIVIGQTLDFNFYAKSDNGIKDITLMSPPGLQKSVVKVDDMNRTDVWYIEVYWTPNQSQKGTHLLCATAESNLGKTSDPRCVSILVSDIDPCDSSPCQNNGTCERIGVTQAYMCVCGPGYTDTFCETRIDYCKSSACLHGGNCINHLTKYTCDCKEPWYGTLCEYSNETSECTYQYSDCSCVFGQRKEQKYHNRDLLCGSIGMLIGLTAIILPYIIWSCYHDRLKHEKTKSSKVQPKSDASDSSI